MNSRSSTFSNGPRKSRNRKRLIVLCDGTWQDSTSDNDADHPSNVTRFSRALSAYALVDNDQGEAEEREQIVYYMKGVGTGTFDRLIGGASGLGVSANVRSAYSFLAHNYDRGDQIYFFGFSRGAYTARAIADLVCTQGLLTKRGMDSFADLYALYHAKLNGKKPSEEKQRYMEKLVSKGLLDRDASRAVEIVGVWDTVAFHKTWLARTFVSRMIGIGKEYIEFNDNKVSPNVQYAFHALALDERRNAFKPTLFRLPAESLSNGVKSDEPSRLKELSQVWFSGKHIDVGGGGGGEQRLADVTLGWMIAQCKKTELLQFDDEYMLGSKSSRAPTMHVDKPWDTRLGETKGGKSIFWKIIDKFVRGMPGISSDRKPLIENDTNETIHVSIADRKFGKNPGPNDAVLYQCGPLTGTKGKDGWQLAQRPGVCLRQCGLLYHEEYFKGRVRPATNLVVDEVMDEE